MVRGDAGSRPAAVCAATRPWSGRLQGRTLCCALLAGVALLGGCATLRTDYVRTASSAKLPVFDSDSGRYVQAELDRHPGQCGFRLLVSGMDALMSRIWLIDHAQHSI